MPFSVRTIADEGGSIVEMRGEADTAVVPELELAFAQAVKATPAAVVIDLSAVTFVDSRVMSVLEAWASRCREGGSRMPIVCDQDEILRLFRIIGLDRQFEFHADRASALAG